MKKTLLSLIAVIYLPFSIWGATQTNSSPNIGAESAFDWIRSLAGEWEGSFEWSGGRSSKGPMSAKYYLTGGSNGTAVVEDLIVAGKPIMTSVYHLDGAALRMTHYCGGNQPRLRASAIDERKKTIHFDLVDVTNLKSPSAAHVQRVEMRLLDENHLTVTFTSREAGVDSYELVQLTRLKRN